MRQFNLVLRDGTIKTVNKGPRDHSASQAAKERRMVASQKGRTNVGNPRDNKS